MRIEVARLVFVAHPRDEFHLRVGLVGGHRDVGRHDAGGGRTSLGVQALAPGGEVAFEEANEIARGVLPAAGRKTPHVTVPDQSSRLVS